MAAFRSTFISFTLSLVMTVISIVALLPVTTAVPDCEWQEEVTRCSVRKQSDFAGLPTNVTKLTVYFPEGHQATLRAAAFPERPNLVELTLDLTNMESSLEPGAFLMLEQLTSLRMVYNHAMYAPAPMMIAAGVFNGLPFLRDLSMQGVGLVQVEQGAFHNLPSLVTLDLGANGLASFPSAAFTDTTELVTIVFSHNKLTALVDGTFSGLNKLETLSLDNNKLRTLGGGAFGNLPSLKTLNLDGNKLTSIGLGTFQGLPKLTNLQLKNNDMNRIGAHVFMGLGALENLDMSHNNITEIADLAFSELANLKFLEIYQNSVRQLTPMTFTGLGKLVFLDMYVNSITELNDNIFRDLQELGTLHLHEANIQRISSGAFNGLTSLNILTLQQNNLSTLPEGVFASLQQLAFLDIAQNPWNCTCGITWIHPWSDGRNFGSETSTRCANNGEALLQYARDNYYICRRPKTTTITTLNPTPTTTKLPVITTEVADEITSPPLIKLTSSIDPGYLTTNDTVLEPKVKQGGFSPNHLIIICVAVSAVFILAVIIAVLIIYCRQKKCAFWTPEHISTLPATSAVVGSEKDRSHFAYSPTKEQSFFGDQPIGSLERRRGKNSNGSAPIETAYDNPALYIEDAMRPHDQPADPAVVAYISENEVQHRNGHFPHSYEHRVSDSGTHYVDRVPHTTDDLPMNDLNRSSSVDHQKPAKKERKRKHSKKPKKTSVSSNDDGDDPYGEVYAQPPIPLSDMIPTPPTSLDNSIQDTSMDSPDYLPPSYQHEHNNLSHEHYDAEHDSALGASTEDAFEDPPREILGDPPTPKPRTTRCKPRHQDHYSDHYLGEEGASEEDQMKRHSDSIGGNSDYVDYQHSYNEDKPLY